MGASITSFCSYSASLVGTMSRMGGPSFCVQESRLSHALCSTDQATVDTYGHVVRCCAIASGFNGRVARFRLRAWAWKQLLPYNGQRPKSRQRSWRIDLFCMGCSLRHTFFCSVLEMCRRGGMLRPFPRWAGRTHEITLYLSAKLNAIALLFKNHFIII